MRGKNLIINCPVCGKRVEWDRSPERPFCSERCRLIDLGQWADETYRIPGEKAPDPDGATLPLINEDR